MIIKVLRFYIAIHDPQTITVADACKNLYKSVLEYLKKMDYIF